MADSVEDPRFDMMHSRNFRFRRRESTQGKQSDGFEPGKEQEADRLVGDTAWDGLHRPRIYYAMFATFCGVFLSVLDGTICNVALPSIAEQLRISSSDSIWVVNAFQLVIMMCLLPFASLGELKGYKYVYLRGVFVFTLGSLCCALSCNLLSLALSRVLQGFGAAMMMSVSHWYCMKWRRLNFLSSLLSISAHQSVVGQ